MNATCLSRLSPRAQRMLEFATWRDEPRDREGVIRLLESKRIAPTEALIELQCCFGGLDYHIERVKSHGWKFSVARCDSSIEDSKTYLLYAVEHQGDPVNFGIDENGIVYIGEKSARVQFWEPVASSFPILLESDALINEAMSLWNPCIFTVQEILGDDHLIESALKEFDKTFERVIEASDQYVKWWMTDELRLHRYFYPSISPACFGFQVYAQDIEFTKKIIRHLMKKNLIRRKEIMIFAYLESTSLLYQGLP